MRGLKSVHLSSVTLLHAPPGELGLTITGNPNSGQVQVNRVKLSSPLCSFIQEGDVLESVDGESIAGLNTTQVSSLISSGANSSTRVLVFVRNRDESSNPMVEQSSERVKVIVYAPPGELGLTIIGDTINGNLIVRSVKSFSPLYGKIQEGDVIISVDGEPTEELTATQVLSLINSWSSNPLHAIAFDRNIESMKCGDIPL
jgi:C-terminal processing protease CtpA/Prc